MNNLFSEFPPVTADQWKKQVEKDLKGEPFDSLLWQNENGFTVKPFYTGEDLSANYLPAFSHTQWRIACEIHEDSQLSVGRLHQQLNQGADAVWTLFDEKITPEALKAVDLDLVSVSFGCKNEDVEAAAGFVEKRNHEAPPATFFPADFKTAAEIKKWTAAISSLNGKVRSLSVPASGWCHAGSLPAHEIALTFAFLTEVSDHYSGPKNAGVTIRTAIDCDLFVQIAKLRAYRRLWELIKNELGLTGELYLQCETAIINKSAFDPYTNLLRTSVEAAAAVLGGCNELLVRPYDMFSETTSDSGLRLAVNQQHILREESYFDKVADAGCGSYYIETLTDNLAESALENLKSIMKSGGYGRLSETGALKSGLETQAASRRQRIEHLEQVIIGVNKFQPKETASVNETLLRNIAKAGIAAVVPGYELSQQLRKA